MAQHDHGAEKKEPIFALTIFVFIGRTINCREKDASVGSNLSRKLFVLLYPAVLGLTIYSF